MGKVRRALGLMSGTSLDGIDVALIETDGEDLVRRGPHGTLPLPPTLRMDLRAAAALAGHLTERTSRFGALAEIERAFTARSAATVEWFLARHRFERQSINVIGFHGQTVLHRPEAGMTVQLGDGPALARLTGIDVVYDLRAADVAAGGQGAPLVPVYHRALAQAVDLRPLAFLNLGGVANLTWIGRDGRLAAFDTGPGNALLDDWMQAKTGEPCDRDGKFAADGQLHEDILHHYLAHPYFAMLPPKSLDRNAFPLSPAEGLKTADGAATLAHFTAAAIGRAREHLPEEPRLWVVCGGGRHNRTLMALIAEHVENAVVPAEALELDGDSLEAEAWAYLAVRSLEGLPITFPGTTGVPVPLSGGLLARARAE